MTRQTPVLFLVICSLLTLPLTNAVVEPDRTPSTECSGDQLLEADGSCISSSSTGTDDQDLSIGTDPNNGGSTTIDITNGNSATFTDDYAADDQDLSVGTDPNNGGSTTININNGNSATFTDDYAANTDATTKCSGNNLLQGDGDCASGASASGSDHDIQYNNGGSFGGASQLNWDDSTNMLGVGLSPHHKAEVANNLTIGSGQNAGTSRLLFDHYYDSSAQTKAGIISVSRGDWGRTEGLYFAINDQTTSDIVDTADTKMFIDRTGNVGIGTTSPGSPLDVHTSEGNLAVYGSGVGDVTLENTVGGSKEIKLTISGSDGVSVSENSQSFYTMSNWDLGKSGSRWNNVYANGKVDVDGTMNVSDSSGAGMEVTDSGNVIVRLGS